ncbi:MAG: tRNA (adenosine(37)-N6)-dimethylallyltransferase MiaA [Deltaproteobacteria bacterium]|jgi:tRNA dimethylallyltransferase|nr:tRNA (adenosine(37)-N6)-dimethylallyltransferase MiaA [Deltaproteobacteria bacterium]
MGEKPKLVIVTGPTGSGKSSLALDVAQDISGEIINADSMAFYRGLDIGTAKPSQGDQRRVRHHLIDILDPTDAFSAADFIRLARPLIGELWAKNKVPLVVGGTGLYLRSLIWGLFEGPGRDQAYRDQLMDMRDSGVCLHGLLAKTDPLAAARIRPSDPARIVRALEVFRLTGESIVTHQERHSLADRPFETLTLALDRPLAEMGERLSQRAREMFKRGLVEEVEGLLRLGYSPSLKPFQSVGYKECLGILDGRLGRAEAERLVIVRTRQLAKRQRTWLRGQAPQAVWLYPEFSPVMGLIGEFLGRD